MASGKEYLNFILDQLSDLQSVSYRAMMGEYVLYYRGKIFGGIYDNRFLVKSVEAARTRLKTASFVVPYPGAKEMLSVDCMEDKNRITELIEAMYEELPTPKKK